MADEQDGRIAARRGDERHRLRIRADLERRGASPEFAQRVAERLAPVAGALTREEYCVAVDTAAIAFEAGRRERAGAARSARDLEEIQRLMQGFASELRKLEEGLRILSAYALRMRAQATSDGSGTLH